MTQKTEEKNPNEEMEIDGFPDYDKEFESVQEINEQMREARDEWDEPEKPTYSESNGSDVYYTGVVRSLKRDAMPREDYSKVEIGIDTGADELKWVSVKDTGERNLENEFVRFCKMYDVNPENIQEIYSKEIYVKNKWDNPVIKPQKPVLRGIWTIYHLQLKTGFFKYKEKEFGTGLVPRFRMIGAYTAFSAAILLMNQPFLIPLFIISAIILSWGLYAKARYDILPYIGSLLTHYWKVYSHKKA